VLKITWVCDRAYFIWYGWHALMQMRTMHTEIQMLDVGVQKMHFGMERSRNCRKVVWEIRWECPTWKGEKSIMWSGPPRAVAEKNVKMSYGKPMECHIKISWRVLDYLWHFTHKKLLSNAELMTITYGASLMSLLSWAKNRELAHEKISRSLCWKYFQARAPDGDKRQTRAWEMVATKIPLANGMISQRRLHQ